MEYYKNAPTLWVVVVVVLKGPHSHPEGSDESLIWSYVLASQEPRVPSDLPGSWRGCQPAGTSEKVMGWAQLQRGSLSGSYSMFLVALWVFLLLLSRPFEGASGRLCWLRWGHVSILALELNCKRN